MTLAKHIIDGETSQGHKTAIVFACHADWEHVIAKFKAHFGDATCINVDTIKYASSYMDDGFDTVSEYLESLIVIN